MSKFWKDFDPYILPWLPGCPPMAAREALREAFDVFCEKTHVWQVNLPAVSLVAGIADYYLPLDTDQRAVTVMAVKYNGIDIAPETDRLMDQDVPGWTDSTSGGQPQAFRVQLDDDAQFITVYPTPTASESSALRIRVAMKLASGATMVPDFFYEDWRRVLAAGAIARLSSIPGKDYTSPDLAIYYTSAFNAGVSKAIRRSNTGMTPRTLTAQPRSFT